MLRRRRFLRKRPGEHKFRFKDGAGALDDAIERRRHPTDHRVANPALDALDDLASRALVPAPIEAFGREPELDEQIPRIIWRLPFAPLLSPQAEQCRLVVAHN